MATSITHAKGLVLIFFSFIHVVFFLEAVNLLVFDGILRKNVKEQVSDKRWQIYRWIRPSHIFDLLTELKRKGMFVHDYNLES